MSSTKALDNKTTLMHFLARLLDERFPDVLGFSEDWLHVDKAARVSPETLLKNINQMQTSIKQVSFVSTSFLYTAYVVYAYLCQFMYCQLYNRLID